MIHWLAVAIGGATGAVSRYAIAGWLYPIYGNKFPFATLVINVSGSIIMGFAYVIIIDKGLLPAEWRNFLMIGFLGAFTTFSTFSLDALALWQNGHLALAFTYILGSVTLCLLGAMCAIYITRLLI